MNKQYEQGRIYERAKVYSMAEVIDKGFQALDDHHLDLESEIEKAELLHDDYLVNQVTGN